MPRRITVVSDVHGNLAALDAVLADLSRVAPNLVVHQVAYDLERASADFRASHMPDAEWAETANRTATPGLPPE